MQITHFIQKFIRDEDGVTAIEYSLIASLIAVVMISAVATVGVKVNTIFTYIGNKLTAPS